MNEEHERIIAELRQEIAELRDKVEQLESGILDGIKGAATHANIFDSYGDKTPDHFATLDYQSSTGIGMVSNWVSLNKAHNDARDTNE